MTLIPEVCPRSYRVYTRKNIDKNQKFKLISKELRNAVKTVSTVLPFKVNNYITEELIDWENLPADPLFQLYFPQADMLDPAARNRIQRLLDAGAPDHTLLSAVRDIQMGFNPHPAGQMEMNVPLVDGSPVAGMQHKYDETVLFFPSHGQTCHAYCTYCFRWAQFVGLDRLRFASRNVDDLVRYLASHTEVTDVLFTGGDPLTMSAALLRRYLEPLIARKPGGLQTIRIGTKVPASWPYRFVTDRDADDLIRLFDEVVDSGLHLAVMVHYSHPRELETAAAQAAVRRIVGTGATVRCQAPLIRHVNDDPEIWARMWRAQVRLGMVPYYMFVERDTGPKHYFKTPLARAYTIFTEAYRRVSGLCRTVRGPSMSATPGKIVIEGVSEINSEKVFVLKFLQGRDSRWVNRLFYAAWDANAHWLDELKPAGGRKRFFFEELLEQIKSERAPDSYLKMA